MENTERQPRKDLTMETEDKYAHARENALASMASIPRRGNANA